MIINLEIIAVKLAMNMRKDLNNFLSTEFRLDS